MASEPTPVSEVTTLRAALVERNKKVRALFEELRNLDLAVEILRRKNEKESADADGRIRELVRGLAAAEDIADRLRSSYVFKLMRHLGLWAWLEGLPTKRDAVAKSPSDQSANDPGQIMVDLTREWTLEPDADVQNMAIGLVRVLGESAPGINFTVVTSELNYDELAFLDSGNIHRVRALERTWGSLVRELEPDILFCPQGASFCLDAAIPTVCLAPNLRHKYYPQFLEAVEGEQRQETDNWVAHAATIILCTSEFEKSCLMENKKVNPDRVKVVSPGYRKPRTPSLADRKAMLRRLGLEAEQFLLYPANFELHKNHEMLLTAFGIFRAEYRDSPLKLVLSGRASLRREFIRNAASGMTLAEHVMLPPYLTEDEFQALVHSCMAVVFPSLFESLATPLLDAMAAGRPVLCSDRTSLPELTGGAALPFDPRNPWEIARCIRRVEKDADLRRGLVQKGTAWLAHFGKPEEIAAQYLEIFRSARGWANQARPAIATNS